MSIRMLNPSSLQVHPVVESLLPPLSPADSERLYGSEHSLHGFWEDTAWLRRQGFPVGAATWDLRPWAIEQPKTEPPRRTGRASTTGYVYFIRGVDSGRIKIGTSTSLPSHRLASFRTGSPEQLESAGYIKQTEAINERTLHERFAETRLHGEWFAPSEALLSYIREHATNG